MNDHNLKYRKIVDMLIKKSFLSLKNHKIFVFEIKKYSWARAVSYNFIFFSVICPTWKARKYSKSAMTGFLAHELCHIDHDNKKPFFKLLRDDFMYSLSRRTYSRIKRETELEIIKRGYGKRLPKAAQEAEKIKTKKELKKRYNLGYLSPIKLKNTKSIKKG